MNTVILEEGGMACFKEEVNFFFNVFFSFFYQHEFDVSRKIQNQTVFYFGMEIHFLFTRCTKLC